MIYDVCIVVWFLEKIFFFLYLFICAPDINECLSVAAPCPAGQVCLNTVGSYTCQRNSVNCGRGYHLNTEGTRCVGMDWSICLYYPSVCFSVYLSGFPTWVSLIMYFPDIDECTGMDDVCAGHSCINLVGSYRCECRAGFIFNSITRVCDGKSTLLPSAFQYSQWII